MLISLATPSLEGVSQRNQYHGALPTSGNLQSAQGGALLVATGSREYDSFVTASCLAAHIGTSPLCSSFYLPNLDGELSQLWRGSNLRSSDHRARMLPLALLSNSIAYWNMGVNSNLIWRLLFSPNLATCHN